MRKAAVVQCPEHVFCEQAITRNTAHPFCIRQYECERAPAYVRRGERRPGARGGRGAGAAGAAARQAGLG